MDEEVRRRLDELSRRVEQLEAELVALRGHPGQPLPPERNPFDRPKPPPPGGYPVEM